MDVVALLRELSEASGVSGYEAAVRDVARSSLEPYAHECLVDALGNLIAVRHGTRTNGVTPRTIMLAAHMDEIGMMVTALEDGFLRVGRVGGVDLRNILGQEVAVHGKRVLHGVVSSRPPHVLPEEKRKQVVPWEELFVDVGLSHERLSELVRVGDLITLRQDFVQLSEGYVAGKAFDDRAGVASLAVCLEELANTAHQWDVYAVATSQEEVGLRGAGVSAFGLNPDVAIAIDVGFGKQKGVSEERAVEMDGGPAVAMGPNVHPLLQSRLVQVAKEQEIKYQLEVAPGATGTDAWAIQVARQGVPTALLSIPLRYMHSPVETLKVADVQRTGRLMARFISGLDESFAAELGLS